MQTTLSIILILTGLFMGCSSAREATRTRDDPTCRTVVEGYLHSRVLFNGKVPALVLHSTPQTKKILTGEIVSVNDSGITFDPAREGPLHDPDAKLYPYSGIQCAIDSTGDIVYGELPERFTNVWNMEVELIREDGPSDKPIKLVLNPNERFSYCINPGSYAVRQIVFNSNRRYVDQGVSLPPMSVVVRENASNYIGDLYLNFASELDSSVCLIKAEAKYRPGYGVMMNFGLIGGIAEALGREGLQGHTLQVRVDSSHGSETNLPKSIVPLIIPGDQKRR
jgi:hypothetical protein